MPTAYVGPWRIAEPIPLDPSVDNTWGTILNTNMSLLQEGATGQVSVSLTGLSSWTLTTSNTASDQSRPSAQIYTGALTTNCIVTLPNVSRLGYASNQTTGGFNVILTSGVGTSAILPPDGGWYLYSSDGAGNVILPPLNKSASYFSLSISSLTSTNISTQQFFCTGSAQFADGIIVSNPASFTSANVAGTLTSQTCEAYFFITLSDYRLKVDFGPYRPVGDIIDSVPVHDAAFKEKPDVRRPMFFAHELPAWAVDGEKDAADKYQGVDMFSLVPLLWREVQELRSRVKALENR